MHARSGHVKDSLNLVVMTSDAPVTKKDVIPNSSTGGTQSHEPSLLHRRQAEKTNHLQQRSATTEPEDGIPLATHMSAQAYLDSSLSPLMQPRRAPNGHGSQALALKKQALAHQRLTGQLMETTEVSAVPRESTGGPTDAHAIAATCAIVIPQHNESASTSKLSQSPRGQN